MKYRVIELKHRFYIQKRIGLLFKRWEFISIYGIPLDSNHDWEDASPIHFQFEHDAIKYMEALVIPKVTEDTARICAWID